MKTLILIALIIGAFILIYKNLNKIKAMYEAVKEKTKTIIHAVKIKVMNIFLSIKNFFGERFLRRLPISRASSEESEIAQAGKDNKQVGR